MYQSQGSPSLSMLSLKFEGVVASFTRPKASQWLATEVIQIHLTCCTNCCVKACFSELQKQQQESKTNKKKKKHRKKKKNNNKKNSNNSSSNSNSTSIASDNNHNKRNKRNKRNRQTQQQMRATTKRRRQRNMIRKTNKNKNRGICLMTSPVPKPWRNKKIHRFTNLHPCPKCKRSSPTVWCSNRFAVQFQGSQN